MLCPQETLLWKTYITETCCFVVQWIELTSDSFWTVRRNNSIWVDVLPIKLLFFVLDCEHEYINRRSRNRASFHINFSSSRLKLQSPTEIWTITFSLFSQSRCNSPQCSSFVWQSWEQYLEHLHQVTWFKFLSLWCSFTIVITGTKMGSADPGEGADVVGYRGGYKEASIDLGRWPYNWGPYTRGWGVSNNRAGASIGQNGLGRWPYNWGWGFSNTRAGAQYGRRWEWLWTITDKNQNDKCKWKMTNEKNQND